MKRPRHVLQGRDYAHGKNTSLQTQGSFYQRKWLREQRLMLYRLHGGTLQPCFQSLFTLWNFMQYCSQEPLK